MSDFGPTGLSHTQCAIDGTLDFTGISVDYPLTVLLVSDTIGGFATLQNFDGSQPYAWAFADASEGITGFDPAAIVFDASNFSPSAGGKFSLAQSGDELQLLYAPVPEPAASALLLAGLLALSTCGVRPCRRLDAESHDPQG